MHRYKPEIGPALLLLIAITALASVAAAQELSDAEREIIQHIEQELAAHRNYDAEGLVALLAEDLTIIQNGQILQQSKQEQLRMFQNYFSAVRFKSYELLQPPVISISDDSTLAVASVLVGVEFVSREEPETSATYKSINGWLAVYEKTESGWIMTKIASTRREVVE